MSTIEQHIPHSAIEIVDDAVAHLQFRAKKNEKPVTSTEFRTTGRAECLGFTILGSEALEKAEVDHSIAFANGHATLVMPIDTQQYMLDPLSPRLRQRVDNKITIQGARTPRITAGWLNRLQVISDADTGDFSYEETVVKYPWLNSPLVLPNFSTSSFQCTSMSNRSLLISIYRPEQGRVALEQYGAFKDAYELDNDVQAAAQAVIAMEDSFPEIDMRTQDPKMVVSIVKRLAIAGDFDTANEVTRTFFSNFNLSRDSRVDEYNADCLRYIATATGHKPLGRQAFALYQRAKANPKSFRNSISAKEKLCPT